MKQPTLMAVHAHPDDEAIGTGGVLARYAREGISTVLVTCTNGELGDLPGGIKPDDDGHDSAEVVRTRRAELEASCRILGIGQVELLGYHDSGMMGWPQNDHPHAFWHVSVEEAAGRLAALIERHRPDVVVTYDENGFYGHPDHIQAHRITVTAARRTGIPRKVYYTAVGLEWIRQIAAAAKQMGFEEMVDFDPENPGFGIPDDQITTIVDVRDVARLKREAIAAHASQPDGAAFLKIPPDAFALAFGTESFVRAYDATGAPLPEDDLFAGLR